jgi:hypothetical protein
MFVCTIGGVESERPPLAPRIDDDQPHSFISESRSISQHILRVR